MQWNLWIFQAYVFYIGFIVSDLVRNIRLHFASRLSLCSHPFPLSWLPAFQRDIQHPSVYFLQLLSAMFVTTINYCNVLPFVSEGCMVALVPLKDFLFPNLLLANFCFYMSYGFKSNDHNTVFTFVFWIPF